MLLFAERRLGVFGNGGGCSRKRLSRYAGLFPEVEGRAIANVILIFEPFVRSSLYACCVSKLFELVEAMFGWFLGYGTGERRMIQLRAM
jgi:hypothetical protein